MKQPIIALGTVSTGGIGTQDVTIGGASSPFKRVAANSTNQQGDSVLILMADDDTPIVIGDGGYSVGS